jgi:branched-chain amino acid transport system substrate-binding protein
MRKRLLAAAAVLTLVGAACSSSNSGSTVDCEEDPFGCVTIAAGEPIQVGTLLAISGDVAFLGLDSQTGVELAVDSLDGTIDGTAGQLLGHEVRLINEDDGCSKEGGQKGATTLAANESIIGVIGTSCSGAALGVADKIFSDKGITIISPSNTNPNLTAEGEHQPFYFRTAHNDKIQGAVVADFAYNELEAKSAATINDESPYADALAAVFRDNFEKLGGAITGSEAIQSSDTDFKPVLTTLGAGEPDFLFFPNFNPSCGLIAKQSAEVPGLADTALAGADGCLEPTFLDTAGAAADGAYASGPDFSSLQEDSFFKDEFLPQYTELRGTAPTAAFHAHAYDAAKILFAAIEEVAQVADDGTVTISRTALRDAVQATSGFSGLSGTITCTELGDCATAVTIAIYEAPAWPVEGGTEGAQPVYTDTKTLDQV